MVKIAPIALTLSLGAAVSGLSIPDVDENGVQVAIGFDPTAAFFTTASDVESPEAVEYNVDELLGLGDLIAEPSANFTEAAIAGRAIYGNDDRVALTDSAYPWSAIGKVQWSNGVWCSGTLVGPRHVITARHCTPTNGEKVSVRFSPFYYNGETKYPGSAVTTYIYATNKAGQCLYGLDWAVHILKDRIGEQRGFFGARTLTSAMLNKNNINNAGYPGDKFNGQRPIRSKGSKLLGMGGCASDSPATANVDTAGGQSGSSIWAADNYVLGTLYGSSSASSIWATGQALTNAISSARKDFK
ncbi:trypsin-like cysteine/serine peptidase domain-containing protein [Microdochium bolleyi]|uniref:Serine protease n=1 Tax=Microdochium bolleyi TaxID=196109 RepID=A0A136IMB6_9PEZI|nr:trypsin-like cysteine/serine peptidase domain-containing protein [Microdochium bolleyi]